MKIRLIIIGFATMAFALGVWAADRNLSDSQMSSVWGGEMCDVRCVQRGWGCDDPYLYTCEWVHDEPNDPYDPCCVGIWEFGNCDTPNRECGIVAENWTCTDGVINGEDCALKYYEYAYCHWIWWNDECHAIYPDDFANRNCYGEFDECYETDWN